MERKHWSIDFRKHALLRMQQRGIKPDDIRAVLENYEIVENYPSDTPYPSCLILGIIGNNPFHVVVAENHIEGQWIVITAYQPDPMQWDAQFKLRRKL